MKHVQLLGLAAMAATALVAFGVSSASAASSLYSTGVKVAAGTTVHATAEGTIAVSTTDTKTLVDTCTSNTVVGNVEYPAGGDARIPFNSLTWGGCTVTTDTVANGAFSISSTGVVTGTGSIVTTNFGGVSCRYGTGEGTVLGSLSTGKLAINVILNEQEPKSFICVDTTRWITNYVFTSPHDLTAGA